MSAGVADLPAASAAGSDGITQKIRYVMIVATRKRKIAQNTRRIRKPATAHMNSRPCFPATKHVLRFREGSSDRDHSIELRPTSGSIQPIEDGVVRGDLDDERHEHAERPRRTD